MFFKSAVSAYKKEWYFFGIVELGRRAVLIATALITNSSGVRGVHDCVFTIRRSSLHALHSTMHQCACIIHVHICLMFLI